MSKELKRRFLKNVALNIAVNGALQRNNIYSFDISPVSRKAFRIKLRKELIKVIDSVIAKKDYEEGTHFTTIINFAKMISNKNSEVLRDGKLNIGTAQKLLNLYWKMLWLFDKNVSMPIHCPFDGIIIKKLDKASRCNWTAMTTIEEYKRLVEAVEKVTHKKMSIAEWELIEYNKSVNKEAVEMI